ncbi:MAG: SpoIIE family protein phosphatase [Oscillospiraceae bacterium]|nr:SpoIIE family protein phosphatase [Oscillospiraceae bacterium]
MRLIVPILLNCALVLCVYLLDKYTPAKKLPHMAKQIIIGVLFGCVSAFASSYGVSWLGAVVNVRDAAPLSAGLIFGGPAGIISGIIGGLYRWFSVYWGGGMYTRLACSIATVLAGFMAAGLRKLMFDNKKPTWGYGICIAVVCEVIHMILIFLTNMDNSSDAFEFVKGATFPMIVGNAAAVGFAIIIVSLLSHERFTRKKGSERIANTFQRWLLACIVIAYLVTSTFTFVLQNGMVKIETQEVFTAAINDVEADIKGKSDLQLLRIAEEVKREYEANPAVSLHALAGKYAIKEINVVNADGLIINSTEADVINNYDMNSKAQSREFVEKLKEQSSFVQKYSPRGKDANIWRKYAAVNLAGGGFIQVGYDAEQFHEMLNAFVVDITKNRHVGTGGFVAVCDDKLCMVIDNEYSGKHISSIGIVPPDEMINGATATALYYADIVDGKTAGSEKYMYVFKFVEGYCIIAAMPQSEAMFMRDASLYTSIFMQVLIFAALFVFIYILIKRVIINNLKKINDTLARITEGDLNVTVDVRSNEEFASLSDDINSTVSTLKRYIAEAAARIDKELEYAKQIQLSALPTNFPKGEDYGIYAQMIAAKEVGGDFYDFYKLGDKTLAFLAADVSGKGIPAAMFMMTAKTIIKDLAESGMPVNEIFTKANEKLCENNESGMFVTVWMGILDLESGKMQFANAGHNPPLLKRANGSFEYLKTRAGFVLAGMEGVRYRAGELDLYPGDRLFLYTDGVPEATNAENKLYGEGRLLDFMNRNSNMIATEILPALKADIDEFVGEAPQFDDITMLMFDFKPEEGGERMTYKTFPAKTEALSDILGFVDQMLDSFACPMKIQTAVCVAIEEVFVNVAHYAYGEGEGDMSLGIGFDEEKRAITFCMRDKGIPFDPLQKPDPDITLSAEEREIGGLGIFITKKTMNSVTYAYENGENILTMIKNI